MEAAVTEKELMEQPLPLPTLSPALSPYVTLGLTVVYTVFYSLLFIFVYVQLWLVLRYRHKRFSYQTAFLSLCLLWSALRTVLFSFYFKNFVTANSLGPFPFWLLYCFPVCLQFFTLCLMNLYFAQVSQRRTRLDGQRDTGAQLRFVQREISFSDRMFKSLINYILDRNRLIKEDIYNHTGSNS